MRKLIPIFKKVGWISGLVGIIAGIIAIWQYIESKSVQNVSGSWTIRTKVLNSSLKRYHGLTLGYKVFVHQDGMNLTCSGEKCWENEGEIPFSRRTPIELQGTIDGGTLKLRVIEKGQRRPTTGFITCSFSSADNKFIGTFESTAANSSGEAEIYLQPD
jgi:hypothetical protein